MEAKGANIASQECYVCSKFSARQKIISVHHQIYNGVDNIFILLLFLLNFKALLIYHIHRLKPYHFFQSKIYSLGLLAYIGSII